MFHQPARLPFAPNRQLRSRPFFALSNLRKNLVRRNKSKMQIRRKPALNIFFRLVALLAVMRKSNLEKMLHLFSRGIFPAANERRRNIVIDGKFRERALRTPRAESDSAAGHFFKISRAIVAPPIAPAFFSGAAVWRFTQMLRQRLLQESPERMRHRKNPVGRPQRQHPARIHRLQSHLQFLRRRRDHPRQKKTWIFVRHDNARIARQRFQQSVPSPAFGSTYGKYVTPALSHAAALSAMPSITNRCMRSLAHSYPQRSASKITSGFPNSRQCSIARSSAKFHVTRRFAIIQYKTYFADGRTAAPLQSRIRIAGTLCNAG